MKLFTFLERQEIMIKRAVSILQHAREIVLNVLDLEAGLSKSAKLLEDPIRGKSTVSYH